MTVQDSISTKALAGFLGLAMAFTFAFAGATSAQAQTSDMSVEELQELVEQLQDQLAALQGDDSAGGSTGSIAGCEADFTQDFSRGDSASEVQQLQRFLNSQVPDVQVASAGKAGSPGSETDFFGPATEAAVTAFQNTYASEVLAPVGLTNGTGYWGPSSRAKANALCDEALASQDDEDGDTGDDEDGDDEDDSDSSELQGGAGSIDDADYVSSLNNEEVGEDADDVEVAGLEIEADSGSDIEIVAVRLNFSDVGSSNNSTDFDDYAEDVSVWFDGEKLAEVDADEFEDDDDYTKTISLDGGAIIRADEEEDLTVAVSGLNNLDSQDAGDDWSVEFENIRYRDAQGAVITDSDTGDINDGSGRTFSFETFATAADSELNISRSSDDQESRVENVDDNDEEDGVELLRFDMEAEGDSDLRVRDLEVTFATSGADFEDIASQVYVEVNGNEYSESTSRSNWTGTTSDAVVTFGDLDEDIDAGDTVEVVVSADINGTDDHSEGSSLIASVSGSNINATDVEDSSGEDLDDSDKTGTANGKEVVFYDEGIFVTLEDTSFSKERPSESGTYERGEYVMTMNIEAFDEDVYLEKQASSTASAASSSFIYSDSGDTFGGGSTTESANISWTGDSGDEEHSGETLKITDGDNENVTLTVILTNDGGSDGFYGIKLDEIKFAASPSLPNQDTEDTTTWTHMTAGLNDFEVDDKFLSN